MTKTKRSKKANSKDADGGYEVGYGKPPKKHQFKPGHSGNRKGRPKGAKNTDTIVREILDRRIPMREDGKERTVSVREGMLMRFAERGLKGDVKAADYMLKLDRQAEGTTSEGAAMDADDREMFDVLIRELEAKREEKDKETPGAK